MNIGNNRSCPRDLGKAIVANIFLKGDTDNPANCRPISFLNTIYKIHASLIQKRLAQYLDHKIQPTQYGFRQSRSTAQPLHMARRIIEMTEATQGNVIMVLLDWEKAFDKIDQSKLVEACSRLNIPEIVVNNIKAIYENPQFKVKDGDLESAYKKQESGIRQGCPLPPYLFLLVE